MRKDLCVESRRIPAGCARRAGRPLRWRVDEPEARGGDGTPAFVLALYAVTFLHLFSVLAAASLALSAMIRLAFR